MDEIDRKSVDIELPFIIGNCNNIYIYIELYLSYYI